MINFKKLVATGMVATMLVGSCLTAFAADPVTGGQDGDGENEGHVDKAVVDVVLPTTTATTFKYTMDPERLIAATNHAKYDEDAVFPDAAADTGVYFLTGDKTYENNSTTVQLTNKGAVAQKVTVTAKLVAGTKDIAILNAAPDSSAQTAGLFLEGNVAGIAKALDANGVTWLLNLPGNDTNYEVTWDGTASKYKFTKKTTGLTPWQAADVIVSGAVTDGIPVEDDTTAPQLSLTWKFENIPDQDDTAYDANPTFSDVSDTVSYTVSAASPSVTISGIGAGVTLSSMTFRKADGTVASLTEGTHWSYSNGTFTVLKPALLTGDYVGATWTLKFSDDTEIVVTTE